MLARIGGGGMALVYKAYDTVLQRHVAVKVLRDQFVHDEEFIQRFRREARSAASLSHPNVVSIYDVGQDGDIHYIVMEYIEGGTLNDIIKERAPLQPEEAAGIAAQICDALSHAHQNGIIHRDIKPHNILINRNGRIKVTDFGIARAATSTDLTQTGAVLGSVHYFSPEHAKGIAQGEKSDIYSLGAVLYQMLTNRLPFPGESPISVALKHLQESFEEPRAINPLIPQSLENIILKAMRKDPNERYASANEMLHDLETCLLPERMSEPKAAYADDDDAEKTIVMPAIRYQRENREANEQPMHDTQVRGRIADSLEDEPAKSRKWVKPTVWLVVVFALLFGTWQGVKAFRGMMEVPEVDVPDLVGQPYEEAVKQLEELQLDVRLTEAEYSDEYAEGIVIRQSKSNIKVKVDSTIYLTVSKGPREYEMPDLTDMTESEARNALIELGFDFERIEILQGYDDKEVGTVIDQDPGPGVMVDPRESTVSLTISQGPGTVAMPNVIGDTLEVAYNKLERINIDRDNVKVVYEPDYSQSAGKVFRQWPYEPNEDISPDAEITLYVSEGLPSDALQGEKLITVSPEQPGVVTSIEIYVSDATGEDRLWGQKEISETTSYRINVVASPQKNRAVIKILNSEGVLLDSHTVTYSELRSMQRGGSVPGGEADDLEAGNADSADEAATGVLSNDDSEMNEE